MRERVIYLIHQLRKAGVGVTLAETLDCFQALQLVEFSREQVYIVLQTTLIKNNRHQKLFDRLFNLTFDLKFFLPHHQLAGMNKLDLPYGLNSEELMSGGGDCGSAGKGLGSQGRPGHTAQRMLQVIQLGDQSAMSQMINAGLANLGDLTKEHLQNPEEALRQIKVFLEWKTAEFLLEKSSPEASAEQMMAWQENLSRFEEILQTTVEDQLILAFGQEALEQVLERNNLSQLDFYRLQDSQVSEMKKIITRLAHKLGTRVSRRKVRAKSGQIDLPSTIRTSMRYGGIPVKLALRKRKPTKPELIILCDLSGSVKLFSEFMLQLAYSMQKKFTIVRSFVFVDTIDEVTEHFHADIPEEAFVQVYNQAIYSKTGFSDYGAVIKDFWQRYGDAVDSKTTVIILGDARCNYQNPGLEGWGNLKNRAKRVFWLNPEGAERWNTEDSIVEQFLPVCHRIFECRNLYQLENVVKEIF